MEFRRLTIHDLDAAYSNRLRGLASDPDAFLVTLAEEKARGHEHFKNTLASAGSENVIFGAVENGAVVGMLGIFSGINRQKTMHKATIWGVHVDASHRGQSVASRLLDMAIEYARTVLNSKVIYLTVAPENPGAVALYQSRGFAQWGIEPMAVFNGEAFTDEIHMSLVL